MREEVVVVEEEEVVKAKSPAGVGEMEEGGEEVEER